MNNQSKNDEAKKNNKEKLSQNHGTLQKGESLSC